jgi:YbbR domain-containing protein
MSLLTRHWELKLMALVFSAVLWFFVTTSEKADMIVSAPLEIGGLPSGITIASERPETIDVQLHGLRNVLARMGPDQVKARLNLAGVRPGEVEVRILPEQVHVPAGITVLRVNPSRIRLTLAPPRS